MACAMQEQRVETERVQCDDTASGVDDLQPNRFATSLSITIANSVASSLFMTVLKSVTYHSCQDIQQITRGQYTASIGCWPCRGISLAARTRTYGMQRAVENLQLRKHGNGAFGTGLLPPNGSISVCADDLHHLVLPCTTYHKLGYSPRGR